MDEVTPWPYGHEEPKVQLADSVRKTMWTTKEGRRPSLYFYYLCSDCANEFWESISIRLPFLGNLMNLMLFVYISQSVLLVSTHSWWSNPQCCPELWIKNTCWTVIILAVEWNSLFQYLKSIHMYMCVHKCRTYKHADRQKYVEPVEYVCPHTWENDCA